MTMPLDPYSPISKTEKRNRSLSYLDSLLLSKNQAVVACCINYIHTLNLRIVFFVCFADKWPFASICHPESHVVIPIVATLSNCQAGLDAVTPCSELDLQKAQFRAAQFETNTSSIKVHQGPVWQQCNVSVIQHEEWSKVHEWTKPQPGLQLFKPIRLRYQKAELFTRSSLQDQLCLGLCRPAVMELQDIASRNIFQHVATGFPTWQDSGVVIPCWGRSLYHSAGSVWILFLTDFILFKIMFIFCFDMSLMFFPLRWELLLPSLSRTRLCMVEAPTCTVHTVDMFVSIRKKHEKHWKTLIYVAVSFVIILDSCAFFCCGVDLALLFDTIRCVWLRMIGLQLASNCH